MLDLSMIDVRLWKSYSAFYGNGTQISNDLMLAQAQCFKYEDEGIEISDTLLKKITGSDTASYPILGINTSTLDIREMEFVLGNEVVTLRSFLGFTQDTECDDSNGCKESSTEFESLTTLAQAYKIAIDSSTAVTTMR